MTKTTVYLEIELEVEYDIDEGQKLIMYPNDIAQEGIPRSLEITGIFLEGKDIGDLLNVENWKYIHEYIENEDEANSDDYYGS